MADRRPRAAGPFVIAASERSDVSLRHTINQYRLPLIVTAFGVLLSITSFMASLKWQSTQAEKDFMWAAAREASLIDGQLLLLEEKMRGVKAFFAATGPTDIAAFKTFTEPMMARTGIEMIGWLPATPAGPKEFSAHSRASPHPLSLSKVITTPEVKTALQKASQARELVISPLFYYTSEGIPARYKAIVVPIKRQELVDGYLVGVFSQAQIYEFDTRLSLQPEKATLYLLEGPATAYPLSALGKSSLILPGTPQEWRDIIRRAPFFYEHKLSHSSKNDRIIFVPTVDYLFGSLGLFPFVVLISSLALTTLLSLLFFQQTRQRMMIALQVEEKTRLLLKTAKNLAEKENKLRAIVDHTIDGLITINARGIVESFNPACEDIFGYTEKEVIGNNIKMLMPEPYHSHHDGYISHYLNTGEARIIGTPGRELTAQRKDGSLMPIDLSISTFTVDGQQYFSGIIRDITYRKEAEKAMARYLEELQVSNRELDDFAYISSHDLKEPLRGLQNFSKFLLEDYADKLDEEGKNKLHTIMDLTKRMEDCLNTLLHYSRLGRTALAVRESDLNEIVRNITTLLAIGLKEKNTEVVITQPLPSIVCDHVRITEVFQNLIGNALKYNDKDSNRIEIGYIEDHPKHPGEKVFFVRDHGIGIKPEYLDTIFKIFKRLHPRNAYGGGTGSGLTIAKKIINQHGGDMWAESEGEGKGTTFLFTIPPGKAR